MLNRLRPNLRLFASLVLVGMLGLQVAQAAHWDDHQLANEAFEVCATCTHTDKGSHGAVEDNQPLPQVCPDADADALNGVVAVSRQFSPASPRGPPTR